MAIPKLGRWMFHAHPGSSRVYVTDYDNNKLLVIDTSSDVISQTITFGGGPSGVAVHPDGTKLYVTSDMGQDNIEIVDASSFTVTETISVPGYPDQIAFNPSGTRAYVTSWGNSVYVIDTVSRAVIATIDVGPTDGGGVDVSPDGFYVYVTTNYLDEDKDKRTNDTVRVIDASTNTVKKKIKVPREPMSLGKFIGGPKFHMTVSAAGSGTGKVISKKLPDIECGNGATKCEADFYVNRKVQLQAIAADGFAFTGWSGGACTKKSKTCTLVIKNDYLVTATFAPK